MSGTPELADARQAVSPTFSRPIGLVKLAIASCFMSRCSSSVKMPRSMPSLPMLYDVSSTPAGTAGVERMSVDVDDAAGGGRSPGA